MKPPAPSKVADGSAQPRPSTIMCTVTRHNLTRVPSLRLRPHLSRYPRGRRASSPKLSLRLPGNGGTPERGSAPHHAPTGVTSALEAYTQKAPVSVSPAPSANRDPTALLPCPGTSNAAESPTSPRRHKCRGRRGPHSTVPASVTPVQARVCKFHAQIHC